MSEKPLPTVWDAAAMLRMMRGDPRSVRSVTEAFLEECPGYLHTLHTALAAGDAEGARHAAHRLKGAAGMLRAHLVQEVARRLEGAASARALEEARELMPRLEEALEELSVSLREFAASPDCGPAGPHLRASS